MSAIHATSLELSARGLVLPNGLRIASVDLKFPSPVVQVSPIYLHEGTVVDVALVVEAEDIEAYLNQRQPSGLSNFRVTAEGGLLRAVATAKVILPVQVGAEGKLQYSEGKLDFIPSRGEVGGVKMPDSMMREFLDKANPLIDARGYPVDIDFKSIKLENNQLCLSARVVTTAAIPRTEA